MHRWVQHCLEPVAQLDKELCTAVWRELVKVVHYNVLDVSEKTEHLQRTGNLDAVAQSGKVKQGQAPEDEVLSHSKASCRQLVVT